MEISASSSSSAYTFDLTATELECIKNSRDFKEQLVQYNIDESLQFFKFRFNGTFGGQSAADYEDLLKDFFTSNQVLASLQTNGEPKIPIVMKSQSLSLAVMTMDFFDRLEENGIVGPGGKIRGCFDEIFDGITVGDLLREVLLNENSENASVYNDSEKTELIYQIFRLFAVGGSLCQPDTTVERYLAITKAVYKELVTVYKDSKTESIKVSGRAFLVEEIQGVDLFKTNQQDSPHNRMIVIVDPVKKVVNILRQSFKSFW